MVRRDRLEGKNKGWEEEDCDIEVLRTHREEEACIRTF